MLAPDTKGDNTLNGGRKIIRKRRAKKKYENGKYITHNVNEQVNHLFEYVAKIIYTMFSVV